MQVCKVGYYVLRKKSYALSIGLHIKNVLIALFLLLSRT